MKKQIFISIIALLVLSFVLVQCTKENTNELTNEKIELRNGSACNPQDLYANYVSCSYSTVTDVITISNIFSSNGNYLFNMCPNVELEVTYFLTECIDDNEHQVILISGLTYDMNELFLSCPELALAVRTASYFGRGYVDLLDMIDDEISQQIEEEIAYNQVLSDHIDCNEDFYSIKYIKNTCYRWEFVPIIGSGQEYRWYKVDCGSSVCCARANIYCASFNPDGSIKNFVKGFPTEYETFEGECEENCSHDCGK